MTLPLGRYFWKLFLANAMAMALVLAGFTWVIVSQLDRFRQEEVSRHLLAQASVLEVTVRDRFDLAHADELNVVAQQVGSTELGGVRITFVLADGTVIGDSVANAADMESHADRPEIRQALATGSGESVRWSHTVAKDMRYVSVRVGSADKPLGVVRVSMAVQSITALAQPAQRLTVAIALASVLAAILLALALALLWSRRIQRLTETARSISGGDLSARVSVIGHDEIAVLGRSLNEMREKLSAQLGTIDRQRRTLDSLVSQLREGVVVVDADGRIVLINSEALELLQLSPQEPDGSFVGSMVERCIPQHKLQDMLSRTNCEASSDRRELASQSTEAASSRYETETHEIELQLTTSAGLRSVLARAFNIRLPGATSDDQSPSTSTQVGRTLVLMDITELTKVMQVKANLAANASHELRTPLAAIRAAIETLHSVDWSSDADAASRFIDVIDRHSGRMEAMIGDLLELSRLESGTGRFVAVSISVKTLFEELHTTFTDALTSKDLHWKTAVSNEDISFSASPQLLRIILHNLIDNAIRFTNTGGQIKLSVSRQDEQVVFVVSDTGCGIAPAEQQRVFERFYQVEQARSGPDRGTGLGLSIVRHAATAMNASIELQSSIGVGTQFTIRMPF